MKICAVGALPRRSVEHGEGPEEVAGAAALVGVADELRVELLVPFDRDASLLLVILLKVMTWRQFVAVMVTHNELTSCMELSLLTFSTLL